MKDFWDARYKEVGYVYGKEANSFLQEQFGLLKPSGRALFPAEGEGRNAVYAAKLGLDVFAFDISQEGQKKALDLARAEDVTINYEVGALDQLDLENQSFDITALIYAHFPAQILSDIHRKIGNLVKPGGFLILEGFSKGHLAMQAQNPKVGGPKDLEMLFSLEQIEQDFSDFESVLLEEVTVELTEGKYHQGRGKVIRFVGRKK